MVTEKNDIDDMEIIYEQVPGDPPFLSIISQIATTILSAIIQGFVAGATEAGKQLLSMFTMERLVGNIVEYFRELAGASVTKTILDASNNEWLGNLFHAFGLDMSALLEVSKNVLDAGFKGLQMGLMNSLNENGINTYNILTAIGKELHLLKSSTESSADGSSTKISNSMDRHSVMISNAYQSSAVFSSYESAKQEEINRQNIQSIFSETEDRVRSRAELTTEEQLKKSYKMHDDEYESRLGIIDKTVGKIIKPIQDFLNETFLEARDILFRTLTQKLPVSYESVGANAMGALATSMGMGFAAHGIAVATDLVHPLKSTGLPQLAAFLADMAGFGAVARFTWYEDMRNFLGTPYHYYSLRYFRPTLPGESTLNELASRQYISIEDYRRALQYHGYNDKWISVFEEAVYRDPNIRDLTMLYEDETQNFDWLYTKVRRAGYDQKDSEIFVRILLKRAMKPYIAGYRYSLEGLYSKGYISEEQLDAHLEVLQLRSEANALIKKSAEFGFIEKYTDDSITLYQGMYDKNLIDEDDYSLALASLGLRDEVIKLIVQRSAVKNKARVAAKETAATQSVIRQRQKLLVQYYTLLYRNSSVDEDAFKSQLLLVGIEPDIVAITVELEKTKKVMLESKTAMTTFETEQSKITKKYESGYVDLFRKDAIDEQELRADLHAIDLEEDYIESIVSTEIFRKIKPATVEIQ